MSHLGTPPTQALPSTSSASPPSLRVDFVSDIVCPWCAIGLHALLQAAKQEGIALDWHMQPFELHPDMGPQGEEILAYLGRKYRLSPEQLAQNQAAIAQRGAELGFHFGERTHTYNSFAAHRLLHWLQEEGSSAQQLALKQALFTAYFTHGENPGDHALLLRLVSELGLDTARAQAVLESDEYTDAIRQRQAYYQQLGIQSVPAAIVERRYLLQGGQPVEVFANALREIAAKKAQETAQQANQG